MEANKKTNIGQTLHIICRFRRTQAASSAIYIMDIAFNKAKLTSSNDIMFISSPNKLNVFSIQNFKYTFKTVFCVSNRSFLKATIRFLFHFWLSLELPQINPNEYFTSYQNLCLLQPLCSLVWLWLYHVIEISFPVQFFIYLLFI